MLEFLKDRSKQKYEVGEFAHANSNLLIIVMDPKDDTIFVAHKNRVAGGRIKAPDGSKSFVIQDLLKNSRFDKTIDGVLMGIMEVLQIKRMQRATNTVMQFLDGALFNIAKRHKFKKSQTEAEAAGAVKSPISAADVVGPRGNI